MKTQTDRATTIEVLAPSMAPPRSRSAPSATRNARWAVLKLALAVVILAVPIVSLAAPAFADNPSDMLGWVNTLRATVKAAPLTADASFASVAQQWANHMASTGVVAHNPNLSAQAPTGWTKMGENVGGGSSVLATYNALVASPPHLANMVDPSFNRTGIGVAIDANGGAWVVEDFGNYPPPPSPTLTFPTAGTHIFPAVQPFSWNQLLGAQYYDLTVGSTKGGIDLVNSGLLQANQLSFTVPTLPGGALWARLYSYVQSTWTTTDVNFTVTGPSTATFTHPTSGETNVDARQPFTWSAVAAATSYCITVGTTRGGVDLLNTGVLPATQTAYTVPALPAGTTLWGGVYTLILGTWHYTDVSFTTASR